MDFVDAVALAFAWFTRKLNRNAHFINRKRFLTEGKFRAYVRQSLFNAARMAMRSRKGGKPLSDVPVELQMADKPMLSVEEGEKLLQLVESLEEPKKTVFRRVFFEEAELHLVGGCLGLDEIEVSHLYQLAIDDLWKLGTSESLPASRRLRRPCFF
jgi:DNA-directed RNA polymerase specialized sigma24 family protein